MKAGGDRMALGGDRQNPVALPLILKCWAETRMLALTCPRSTIVQSAALT
jgi:hypothetical protein